MTRQGSTPVHTAFLPWRGWNLPQDMNKAEQLNSAYTVLRYVISLYYYVQFAKPTNTEDQHSAPQSNVKNRDSRCIFWVNVPHELLPGHWDIGFWVEETISSCRLSPSPLTSFKLPSASTCLQSTSANLDIHMKIARPRQRLVGGVRFSHSIRSSETHL